MNYTVIVDQEDECELASKVQEYMKHGWVPCGGISITPMPAGGIYPFLGDEDHPYLLFAQAMTHPHDQAYMPGVDDRNDRQGRK